MEDKKREPRYSSTVVCVGVGVSGIALGAHLKLKYGFDDIRFYEREAAIGGTWLLNSYPGCTCDVPSALYSFSFAQNRAWTVAYPTGSEIRAYCERVAEQFDIPRRTALRTEVVRAAWDGAARQWLVHLRHCDSGAEFTHRCRILFNAGGFLAHPHIPDLPGRGCFAGVAMHTARWDAGVSLDGKRVAVIGNGCTGVQVVAAIAPTAAAVVHVGRSRQWIQPAIELPYTPAVRWVLRHIPLAQALHRLVVFLGAEWDYPLQTMTAFGAWRRRAKMRQVAAYMRRRAPPQYHAMLVPDFPISCKRRIYDSRPSYLETLARPNTTLTDSPIVEITASGVRTAAAEHPADVLVYATGFKMNDPALALPVVGRLGTTLSEHWAALGGPGAYLTTANHGFPNYFMLMGPNSATGHTSAIMACENTILYALRVLKPVLDGSAAAVEPTRAAELAYVRRLQAALKGSVFNNGCHSWYQNRATGWNASTYPWSQFTFYFSSLFVRWSHWSVDAPSPPPKQPGGWAPSAVLLLLPLLLAGALGSALWGPGLP